MQLPVFKLNLRLARTGVSVAFLLALMALAGCRGVTAAPPPKPPDVEVADVLQKDVPIVSEWTATLDGYVTPQIQPRLSGYLIKQADKECSHSRKDQLLFDS